MATELKTNTATRITVGPFIDVTDGKTPEVALTATNEKLTLVVDTGGVPTLVLDANATASAGNNDLVHVTNDDAGYYDLELTAAQLNYLGNAKLAITYVTDHLPVFHELNIVSAQYWDAKYGTGNLSADLKAITAGVDFSATMKTSIETACDATVGGGTGTALTAIPWNAAWDAEVQSECDDAITANAIVLDLPTTAEFNARSLPSADYVVVTDTIAAVTAATVSAIGANVITAASMNADAGTEIAAAVWAKTGAITSLATELLLERLYEMVNNKMIVTEATGAVALRNLADSADVATGNVQDLGATTQRNALTWV